MVTKKISGLYVITNLINNKNYIGKSVDIKRRINTHKNLLKNNKHKNIHLQSSWNKYGESNFQFDVIKLCNESDLNKLESFYIKQYRSFDDNYGYNQTFGGENNHFTEEAKEIHRERMNNLFGHSIYQIDLNGNIVRTWTSARKASRDLNIKQDCIYECLQTKRRTYKGFIWVYVEQINDFDIYNYINKKGQKRTVIQFNMNGDIIRTWESATSASSEGFDSSAIIKCCKGIYKHHRGCVWRYGND